MNATLFDGLPALGVFLLFFIMILLFYEAGFQIARRYYIKKNIEEPSTLGQISGGLIGMWAFVLAFTFSIVANQYKSRKDLVMDEANAVGTLYLRTDLIPSENAQPLKKDLIEYVKIRLEAINQKNIQQSIAASVEIQNNLWDNVARLSVANPNTNTSLLTQALNEVIDIHEKRVYAGLNMRIPSSIWLTLFIISFLATLTIGLQAGFNKSRRLLLIVPLIMAFASLTTLIVDLNKPQSGSIKIDQQPIQSLLKSMEENV